MVRKIFQSLLLGSALLVGIAIFVVVMQVSPRRRPDDPSRIEISPETTWLTQPVDEHGYLKVVEALNAKLSEGVTPENNAAVLYMEAIGGEAEGRVLQFECEQLGIKLPIEGPRFRNFVMVPQREGDLVISQAEYEEVSKGPFARKDFPATVAWIEANAEPLAKIALATERPRFFVPRTSNGNGVWGVLLSDVQWMRSIARCLQLRAYLAIEEGRMDDAWKDQLTLHRLARLVSQGPFLVERLVGIAIDGMACETDFRWLQAQPLMTVGLTERLKEFQALPPLPPVASSVGFERLLTVDLCQRMDRGETLDDFVQQEGDWNLEILKRARINWNSVLKHTNVRYEQLEEAFGIVEPSERQQRLAELSEALKTEQNELMGSAGGTIKLVARFALGSREQNSEDVATILVARLVPATELICKAEDRSLNFRALVQIGFALTQYRLDHDAYPVSLDDLKLDPESKLTIDRMTSKPFVYQLGEQGDLKVYQLGNNQVDDGGPGPAIVNGGPGFSDDLGISWPAP